MGRVEVFTTILAATDLSPSGNDAVHRAAILASANGARLVVLHVLKAARLGAACAAEAERARAALRRLAVEIAAAHDVTAQVQLVAGDPRARLAQAAQHADLTVIGRRPRRGWLETLLTGRTAEHLLANIAKPLLVVRRATHEPYRRLFVAWDPQGSADAALRLAAGLARQPGGAHLSVFHAIDSQREAVLRDADVSEALIRQSRWREEAGAVARMRRAAVRMGLDCTAIGFAVAHGPAVRATLRQAQQHVADLVVAGRRGPASAGGLRAFGSVSGRVLASAGCDMLIVPNVVDELRLAGLTGKAPAPGDAHAPQAPRALPTPHGASTRGAWRAPAAWPPPPQLSTRIRNPP